MSAYQLCCPRPQKGKLSSTSVKEEPFWRLSTSLLGMNRNALNWSGSLYISGSRIIAFWGTQAQLPTGMYVPSNKVNGFKTLRRTDTTVERIG